MTRVGFGFRFLWCTRTAGILNFHKQKVTCFDTLSMLSAQSCVVRRRAPSIIYYMFIVRGMGKNIITQLHAVHSQKPKLQIIHDDEDDDAMPNLVNNTEANMSCWIKEGNIIAGIFVYQGIRATIVKTISFSNV